MAFFLPLFPRLLPVIIIIMIINWLVSGTYLKTIPRLLKEKWRILTLSFVSLYLLYLAGILYSTNYAYGWFDLEVKLSLFLLPVIFATSDPVIFNASGLRLFFASFIAGCVAGSLVLLGHAWMVSATPGVSDAFYYTSLAWYFHTSYLAMYYTIGVGITLYYLAVDFSKHSIHKRVILSLIILYLEVLIFLLSSKAGLIMLAATEVLFVLLLIFKKTGITPILIVSIMMVMAFAGFSRVFPYAFRRISAADSMISSSHSVHSNPNDGTVARLEIWKVSIGLIRQHFLTGVGTGDVKDVLIEAYQQQNLYPISNKKLNAHNQYLQTFITLGVFGFLILAASLLIPAWRSLRNRDFLYLLFLITFAINILFESMLEVQAGVVFYALFNTLLFTADQPDPSDNSFDILAGETGS
jgi:O-antigen ligase